MKLTTFLFPVLLGFLAGYGTLPLTLAFGGKTLPFFYGVGLFLYVYAVLVCIAVDAVAELLQRYPED